MREPRLRSETLRRLRRPALALLLGSLAACSHAAASRSSASPNVPVVAAPPSQAPSAAPLAPPPTRSHESLVAERCAELAERHRDALLAYPAQSAFHDAGASHDEAERSFDVEGMAVCSEADGGVWGVIAAPPQGEPAYGVLNLELAFLPFERVGSASTPVHEALASISPGTTENPQLGASVFDYDGDHLPEIFISIDRRDDHEEDGPCIPYEGRHETWLLSVRRAGPSSSASLVFVPVRPRPGATLLTVTDADRDGRPDFVIADPYELGSTVCTYEDAPAFLAHALPGGAFSLDDAAAQRFARTSCSDAEEPAVSPTLRAVACARVLGATREAVERALRQRCGTPRARRSPGCAALPELLRAAAVTPPVTSPRP